MEDNGTTIWIDRETKDELQKIADNNGRTQIGQIRWWIKHELAALNETQQLEPEKSSEQSGQ
jgi:hypothetical protein